MLEEIDKSILYSLDEDSAKSLTQISQETGITPQLVKYHLEKMERECIILAYWPMIEFRKLGYFNVSYFLKLKNVSREIEKSLYAYLKRVNDFNIVMRGDGYWDVHVTISAQSIFAAVSVFDAFYDKFHSFILRYDTAISVGFYQFRREYLNPSRATKKNLNTLAFTGADTEKVALKKDALRLVEALNKNCRQSYADLSRSLKLSREKILYTNKKIQKLGIIQSKTYLLNHEKIGYPRFRILLRTTNLTSQLFQDFFQFSKNHPNIIHLLRLFGNWQILLDVEIENRKNLRALLKEIMYKYGNLVLQIETTEAYAIDKFRDIPLQLK